MNKIILSSVAILAFTLCIASYAAVLQSETYSAHFIIGSGNLPDVKFGFYTAKGSEVTDFNFSGLKSNSESVFNYTLKQKTSFDLLAYIRWDYSCMPISYLTISASFNNSQWNYANSVIWHTMSVIPISFVINVGNVTDTEWQCDLKFTVATTL